MYIVYIYTSSCTKCSIYTLSSPTLQNHNMGKAEFRAQAIGMLQAGSNQAKLAELTKVSGRQVKCRWKRWTSQKSLWDAQKSGRPSVLGKRLKWLFQNLSTKEAGVQGNWSTNSISTIIRAPKTLFIDILDSTLKLKRGKTGPVKTGKRSYLQTSAPCTSQCLEIYKMTVFGLWTSQKLSL